MKLNTTIGWLVIAAILSCGVTACKKGPQRVTKIPGQGVTPGPETPGKPIEPVTTPIKIDDGSKPATSALTPETPSGITGTPHDFSTWKADAETFAAQTVYFDFDKSVVKANELPKVEEVAKRMKGLPGKAIRVEGHCDERGTEEYNRALGERRAQAIREALAQLGFPPDMIDTISYGEDRPAEPGHNEAAWSKNRRGVFVLLSPPAGGGN